MVDMADVVDAVDVVVTARQVVLSQWVEVVSPVAAAVSLLLFETIDRREKLYYYLSNFQSFFCSSECYKLFQQVSLFNDEQLSSVVGFTFNFYLQTECYKESLQCF